MLVESLCAVLMALKISSAEAETEMPVKHIIFSLMRNSADSGEELWPLIFQTELRVLPLINWSRVGHVPSNTLQKQCQPKRWGLTKARREAGGRGR